MTYRVSWDIDIDNAASPIDAARKAHDMVRRPASSANVYNVEAPDGVVTVVDLEEVRGPRIAPSSPLLLQALDRAERFIAGFEADASQEGVDRLLADIRAALTGRSDSQIVEETNALARYLMAELIGTGYQVPDTWKFYEERDPRSRKAWMHAVAIMEMMTLTDAANALPNLDPDGSKPDSQVTVAGWQYEVAKGATRRAYEDWVAAKHDAPAPAITASGLQRGHLEGSILMPNVYGGKNFVGRVNYPATATPREGGQTQDFNNPGEIEAAEDEAEGVILHFVPEAWVNDYAVVVDPEGGCEWTVARKLFLENFPSEDDWNERNQVRDDMRFEGTAPAWVRDWTGPFEVELVDDPASVWPAFVDDEGG